VGTLLQPVTHTAKSPVQPQQLMGKATMLPLVQELLMLAAKAAASALALLPVGKPGTLVLPKLKQHCDRMDHAQGVLLARPWTWKRRQKNGPVVGGHVGNGG
jgi:hypothetical protein